MTDETKPMTDIRSPIVPEPTNVDAQRARRIEEKKEARLHARRNFIRSSALMVGVTGGFLTGGIAAEEATRPANQMPVLDNDQLEQAAQEKLQVYLDTAKPGELKAGAVVTFYQATLKSLRETNDAAREHNKGSQLAAFGGAVALGAVAATAAVMGTGTVTPDHDGSKPSRGR